MKDYIIVEREISGGIQKVYKFGNGYGASVISNNYSYGNEQGLWEMALLTFKYNRKGELMWDVVYRNDFANGNVAGYLSDEEVLELLEWIKSLEK